MGLPGHRRTSSDKRRRASHFALKATTLSTDKKTGALHVPHQAAPGAIEYNGHAIHRKGQDKKMEKILKKGSASHSDHDHDHDGHTHAA